MIENIEQLEKEIEEFQKNILASTQLVEVLQRTNKTIQQQQKSFDADTKALLKKYDEQLKQTTDQLRAHSDESVAQLTKELTDTQGKILSDAVHEIAASNEYVSAQLQENTKLITDAQASLQGKYTSFMETLEETNISQLFSSVQELKASLNKKLTPLYVGVGLTLALSIASFFIK